MREHVQMTIRDLSGEIARLQDTIALLHKMGSEELVIVRNGITAPPVDNDHVAPGCEQFTQQRGKKPARRIKGRALVDGVRWGVARRRTESSEKAMAACAILNEPFRAPDLARMSGMSPKVACCCLFRWSKKGLIQKVGFGEYKRTAKFPTGKPANGSGDEAVPTPTSGRIKIPGLDKEQLTVEQQLEKALKDRDEAVGRGQEKLARIFQDKIDRLQAQLV